MSFIKVKDPRKREELIRDFIETRKRIKDNFVAKKVEEIEYQTGLTKLFKPVTETQKATAKEITEAQKAAAEKITQELLPIKAGIEGLPEAISFPTYPALEMTEEELIKIGPIARKYIQSNLGHTTTRAGLYSENDNLKIGYKPVKIENNNIFINGEDFKGTSGLWELITSNNIPKKGKYNSKELRDYIHIMDITKATYDKNNKRVGGNNNKMNKLIKPLVIALEKDGEDGLIDEIDEHFWELEEEYEEPALYPFTPTKGTGLKILPSDPNALIDRFDLLFSSKKAGHTGVRNEIVSILDELKRQGVLKTNEYKKLNSLIKK